MDDKNRKLYEALTDNSARGQSFITSNWSVFVKMVDFFDGDEIERYRDGLTMFLKTRFESKLSHKIVFDRGEEYQISEDKQVLLRPLVAEAVVRMQPGKFNDFYRAYERVKDDFSGEFNIFGFDFIKEVLLSEDENAKKLKQKIMKSKLGRIR
jgi:hypothetical protein